MRIIVMFMQLLAEREPEAPVVLVVLVTRT